MENPILFNYFVDLFLTHHRGFVLLENNSENSSNNSDTSDTEWSSKSTLKNSETNSQCFSEDSDSDIEWYLSRTPCNSGVSTPLTEYSNDDEGFYDNGSDYSYNYYSD